MHVTGRPDKIAIRKVKDSFSKSCLHEPAFQLETDYWTRYHVAELVISLFDCDRIASVILCRRNTVTRHLVTQFSISCRRSLRSVQNSHATGEKTGTSARSLGQDTGRARPAGLGQSAGGNRALAWYGGP